jgi:RimJ/RimL family protein N-acetyltransferase
MRQRPVDEQPGWMDTNRRVAVREAPPHTSWTGRLFLVGTTDVSGSGPIGLIALDPATDGILSAEIWIATAFRDRGVATAALAQVLATLRVSGLTGQVRARVPLSAGARQRVLERNGFVAVTEAEAEEDPAPAPAHHGCVIMRLPPTGDPIAFPRA